MNPEFTNRSEYPLPQDLQVLLTVVREQSFAAAARQLGQSPAYVSKRIQTLESTLGCRLLQRSTRSLKLTADGERVLPWATQVLNSLRDMQDDLSDARVSPKGRMLICSSAGFGRSYLAPAVSALSQQYPQLEIRLEVTDRLVDITEEGIDLEIHVGDELPPQHISRLLIANQRILCASPDYLQKHGTPQTLADLSQHQCLVLKEKNNVFGLWALEHDGQVETVKVRGPLSSNNGEIVMQWALDHCGIILRSQWDASPHLQSGRLLQVLPQYSQSANIWAVYPQRLSQSARLRVCVEFLQTWLQRVL
ncbi:MAG: LysR family transcriptional regulator [Oleibacter sp.]|nr:LysR family transcriptional regulator [Thalassolituus sp.]|tara:strand:+ start:2038 stop:2958 length:921 start_codon:yes stop_codon:yes gene_type:complete